MFYIKVCTSGKKFIRYAMYKFSDATIDTVENTVILERNDGVTCK